jgi:hypothetical protein
MSLTFSKVGSAARRVAVVLTVSALAAATGCLHVSQRAWDNGRAMSSSMQYRDVLAGRRDPAAMRALYYTSTSLPYSQHSVRYPAFGRW